MTRIKRIVFTAMASLGLIMPALIPTAAYAASDGDTIRSGLCSGANLSVRDTTDCTAAGDNEENIDNLITTIINIFSLIVGLIAVIMIIIGGIKYITSGGDSGNVTGAKNTILYAVIGLVVVALAQLIVNFVLNTASGI